MIHPVLIRAKYLTLLFHYITAVNLFHPALLSEGKHLILRHIVHKPHKQIVLCKSLLKRRQMNSFPFKAEEAHFQRHLARYEFRFYLTRLSEPCFRKTGLCCCQILLECVTLGKCLARLTGCIRHNFKLQGKRSDL